MVVVELGLSAAGSSKSRGLYTILGPPSRHCMKFVPKVLNPELKPFSNPEIKSNNPKKFQLEIYFRILYALINKKTESFVSL